MNIGTKTENGGTTAEGRLSAAEFNALVAQVEANATDISSLDASRVGYVLVTELNGINTVWLYTKKGGKLVGYYDSPASGVVASIISRMTSAETRITALEEAETTDSTKVGYGSQTDKSHKTTLAFYATKDSTEALFTLECASADVYGLLNDRLTILENRAPQTSVKVIDNYDLKTLMEKGYAGTDLTAVADLLTSGSTGVTLMRTEPNGESDSFFSGYTYIVYDGKSFSLTKRQYVYGFHYFGKAEQGRFSITQTGTSYAMGETETISLMSSELVAENTETVAEILAVLEEEETETT